MSAVRHGVAVKRSFARCIVPGEENFSSEGASERSERDTRMIKSRFLEKLRNDRESVKDGNEVVQEEDRGRGQEFFRKNSISI